MPGKKTDQREGISDAQAKRRKSWAELMQDTNKDLAFKMALVELEIDALKDPEDMLAERISRSEGNRRDAYLRKLKEWEQLNFETIVAEVARETGADPEQIANPETRTPEQQQAMHVASARRQLARHMMLLSSDFMIALDTLTSFKGQFEDIERIDEIKRLFLLYYFTTRPFRPSETGNFTNEKEQLIDQYKRFESYLYEYFHKHEKSEDDNFFLVLKGFIAKENPDDAKEIIENLNSTKEIIENLTSVLPDKYVIPNNKLSNTIAKEGIVDIGEITLRVSKKGAKNLIKTTCVLTYEGDNVKLSGRQTFTEYDRNVYNAVSSLYVYGDQMHVMTPAMVYRAMTGQRESENLSAKQIAAVTRSLDKMRFIRAQIDCTAELQSRNLKLDSQQINSGEIDTYLLAAEILKVNAGGQTVKAYRIIKTPILYEYSAAIKQVLTVPASMLDVKELSELRDEDGKHKTVITSRSLPNTESRIQIKGYLIRRIEGMKGKNALNNPVISLYDYKKDEETHRGLYSVAGKPKAKRTEQQRIRDDAEKMLSYWTAIGYIKGYELRTEGKKITGYKIIL